MRNLFLIGIIFLASCSILGVHFKIHNPSRAGKYPKKTEALVLLGNENSKYRTCYDVKYYSLDVLFPGNLLKEKKIEVQTQMDFVAVCDFDSIQIDLAETMKLQWVNFTNSERGTPKFSRVHSIVWVIFRGEKGKKYSLSMLAIGAPIEARRPPWAGGFVRKEDNLKKPWWGVACEGEGASLWWPCKDVMNDEPDSVDMYYKVPDPYIAVGNGTLIAKKELGGCCKLNEYHWHVSYPINIYDVTFYIGNFKLLHDTYYSAVTHDTLQLNHYVLEQNYDKAKTHFLQLKKYLAFYEKTFGPYPWYRDGFKLVESPYEGMEHQSAIAYGNGFQSDLRYGFDYIILHETAHEWWGNSVTAKDMSDVWLHEGFATYAEALYVESAFGHADYLKYLAEQKMFIINRRPVIGASGLRYFNYKDSDIYMKGTWVLHSLRYVIANDSLFFDIIHSFYMENRMKEIGTDKFEEIVNRKTGKDFHWFFQTYLYNRFTPELEYCVSGGKLFYRWGKTNADFKMEVGRTISDQPGYSMISPVADKIKFEVLENPKQPIFFNDGQCLFKPVENKNLVKEFQKQK